MLYHITYYYDILATHPCLAWLGLSSSVRPKRCSRGLPRICGCVPRLVWPQMPVQREKDRSMYVYIYIHMYIYISVLYVYMYTRTQTCMYVYAYIHTYKESTRMCRKCCWNSVGFADGLWTALEASVSQGSHSEGSP